MKFPKRAAKPQSHADILDMYQRGILTCGFMWAVASSDDVFAARLRRLGIPRE